MPVSLVNLEKIVTLGESFYQSGLKDLCNFLGESLNTSLYERMNVQM